MLKKIYQALEDDISRDIFVNRYFYSMTGDSRFMDAIVRKYVSSDGINSKGEIYYLLKGIEEYSSPRRLILYGCGEIGKRIYRELEAKIYGFCDKDTIKQEKGFMGKPVFSPERLVEEKEDYDILIGSTLYYEEIYQWAKEKELHIALDNLSVMKEFKNLIKNQYFDLDIIRFDAQEVFVDGGSLNYFTAKQLLDICDTVKTIYAFEPDPKCAKRCREEAKKLREHEFEVIEKGLYKENASLCFKSMNGGESSIDESGEIRIEACTLDSQITDRVTFIKLDIEGAELDALQGAQTIIQKYRPKLAICVYHRENDILDIPDYLLELVPDYKLYLRHYSDCDTETVLYAI